MKNFMITPGFSTSQMEQRSSDQIVLDVNDDNIDNGQCHHFSISGYVREMQMNDSNFRSLFDDHINSLLVTTKTFRRWYCESCRHKLEPLHNNTSTPARMLNEFARGLKHDVRKELSQETGSEECRSPSYNIESMKVDRVVNDSYESTPINRRNGAAKCHSPVLKTYKRRKNTKVHEVINNSSFVEYQDTSGMASTFAHALPSSSSYNSEKAAQISIEPRNQSALNLIQVNGFRSILETKAGNMFDPRMSGPLTGYYTSDHMQGRHLHGSVDLWKHTCFTQCEVSTGNMPSRCLLPNSYHLHDQYDVENFIWYRDSNIINESCAPIMDISAKYQHPHCPSKPFRPVPRIGVLSPMLQKEVTTYSESCGTQSGYRLGMSEEEMPCQMYRGENSASSSQKFQAMYSPQHLGYVNSVGIPELLPERENSHSSKGKSKMVYSSDKSAQQDICHVQAQALSLSGVATNAATRGRS
ncbi:uncharacterized protein [Triticum aestivum]|uniref:uncharacterized protein isoform X1 n=2 Tax=Triticum aestivum TaxID=4565 RepID=UPI001D031962|nr:uncharacterized protein LOC123044236 isoform X1 [Triticum aestivum]